MDFSKALHPPFTATREQRLLTKDGWRWYSVADSAVLDAEGEVESLVTTGRDITARKELEDRLLQSQRLQAVGELAGGVAHDFNNILQSIMGSLEFAIMDTDPDTQVHKDVQQARKSADKAAGLTRQLLAFSRRQVIKPVNIYLDEVIEDSQGLVQRAIGDQVSTVYRLNSGTSVIRADSTQLQQVLLNLCMNARDAIVETGTITISTDEVTLDQAACEAHSWAREGDFVRLSVVDDGCGMDQATRDQVFEPFFTTKKDRGGTGLGLSTVYGIVKQHGGLLDVRSNPAQGTAFHLYFERSTGDVADAAENAGDQVLGGRETILIAEDDDPVLAFATRVLENAGYEILQARNGNEAVDLFHINGSRIGLVVLDVMMPKMGGREVHDLIRKLSPDLPVLFCSAYDAETIHTQFILDEGLELLPKPYDREQMLVRVRRLLDAHKTNRSC